MPPEQKNPRKDLRQQLEELLAARVRWMGLGNLDLGDDGIGVHLAQILLDAGVPDVIVAGTTPDRYIGRAGDNGFDRLIFLDAVDFGAAPGSVVLLDARQISARFPQISTHKISLGILAQWIEASGKTKVWLLGVQPESMRDGRELTPTISATLEFLRALLLDLITGKTHAGADAPVRPAERSSAMKRAAGVVPLQNGTLTQADEAITI
jgi:hydrogenase maturation protease